MLEVIRSPRRGDVVERACAGERLPEDRVADEPVLALRGQQRLELRRDRTRRTAATTIAVKHESQYHCYG